MGGVIYIGGYSRSGSTLLDIVLGSHPEICSAGELCYLAADWNLENRTCACGTRYPECPFWEGAWNSGDDAHGFSRLLRTVESRRHLGRLVRNEVEADLADRYRQANMRLFDRIRERSGKPWVLDSSKSAKDAAGRALALHRLCGEEVRLVHLVRHPRAVLRSYLEKGSNWAAEGHGRRKRMLGARAVFGWILANKIAWRVGQVLPSGCYMQVRHEDFLADPAREIERIGAFTGVEMGALAARLRDGGDFETGHNVGGNRMRKAGKIRVKKQENDAPESVSAIYRWMLELCGGRWIRRLGYETTEHRS